MTASVIATGVEVGYFTAPDDAGHPAAVQLPLTLMQANNFAGTLFVPHSGAISVTSSTTFVDTLLDTPALVAGASYIIDGYLSITNGASGGLKLSSNISTATATALQMDTWAYNTTTLAAQSSITALATNMVALTGAVTAVIIKGFLTVNAAGTFGLEFAQNVSNGTATVLNVGSWLRLTRIA